jgi:hypothetical protein
LARISQAFFPPRYWQEFEDLTVAVFPDVFGDPSPTKFGRPGQCQNGVDVYGMWRRTNGLVGIQCKRMEERDENNDPFPGGIVSKSILLEEYKKALEFRPALERWILATTAKRDAAVQRYALELNANSVEEGRFAVSVWFWDDYVTYLNLNDELTRFYYSAVLELRTPEDRDRQLLELFRTAFSRAAFYTSFDRENAEDFLSALRDTQMALNTGELVDRETRHVIRKVIGGWHDLQDASLRDGCRKVSEGLKKLRADIHDAIADQSIIKHPNGGMTVVVPAMRDSLEMLRQGCVDEMNDVLALAGMGLI